VRRSELSRHADPRQADDEQNLCEYEIANAELLLERCAVRLYARLGLRELVDADVARSRARFRENRPVRAHASSPRAAGARGKTRSVRDSLHPRWENEKNTVSNLMCR